MLGGPDEEKEGQGNHFKPSPPFPASQFIGKKTARCLQLPTAPLGAVKINPAFPVLGGNTDTNGDQASGGQRVEQQPQRQCGRQLIRPPKSICCLGLSGQWVSQKETSVSRWLSEDKLGMIINLRQMRIWEINPHLLKPTPNRLSTTVNQASLHMDADQHTWRNSLSHP